MRQAHRYSKLCGYGTPVVRAKDSSRSPEARRIDHVSLLEETLEEEKETDEKLTELAKQINGEANEGSGEAEEEKILKKAKRAA